MVREDPSQQAIGAAVEDDVARDIAEIDADQGQRLLLGMRLAS